MKQTRQAVRAIKQFIFLRCLCFHSITSLLRFDIEIFWLNGFHSSGIIRQKGTLAKRLGAAGASNDPSLSRSNIEKNNLRKWSKTWKQIMVGVKEKSCFLLWKNKMQQNCKKRGRRKRRTKIIKPLFANRDKWWNRQNMNGRCFFGVFILKKVSDFLSVVTKCTAAEMPQHWHRLASQQSD
jgi:hypothetical protein